MVNSTPRPHFTPEKDPVPILQEAGWAPGPVWTGGKSRPHRDSIPDRPARSQLLYRLSYPATVHNVYIWNYQTHPFNLRLFITVNCIEIMTFYLGFQVLIDINTSRPAASLCSTRFTTPKFHLLPTQCIYVFCVDLRTNRDYFPIRH